MSVTILRGNALALPLADASVDLVVTSPPYFAVRSYEDNGEHYAGQLGDEPTPSEFVAALILATREMIRVTKPSGSIWVNLGDKFATYAGNRSAGRSSLQGATDRSRKVVARKHGLDGGGEVRQKSLMGIPWRYAIRCIDDLDLTLRAEVVWSKPNGLPESVRDRVRRSHETWFHFTKGPRYYADLTDIREPHADTSAHAASRRQPADARLEAAGAGRVSTNHPDGKIPSSVWTIATQPLRLPPELGVRHHAAFPMAWPSRIIKGWAPAAGVVLDPFGGTGTTALVADVLGRQGITVDMSADYCRAATWRTGDPKERAKAARISKKES